MADGRRLGKVNKSPRISNSSTDLDKIWHGYAARPLQPPDRYKFKILNIQDGSGRRLKISPPQFDRF